MQTLKRKNLEEAAKKIIHKRFLECNGALLIGGVVRREEILTPGLNIMVFQKSCPFSYRQSFYASGWQMELFVHTLFSYKSFSRSDCERARPSLPRRGAEGIILQDHGVIKKLQQEAKVMLEDEAAVWPAETIQLKRYFLTDVLEDFIGSSKRGEALFIAGMLAVARIVKVAITGAAALR